MNNLQAAQDAMRAKKVSAATRGTDVSGPRPRLDMKPEDPLYEMLPSPEKIKEMPWQPRSTPGYVMPPVLQSSGVSDSLQVSTSTIIRQFLLDGRKSQIDRQGRTRFIQILTNLCEIASKPGPQAVAAANAVFDRGWGKIKPSEEELEAKKNQGYSVVHIHRVEGNIPVHDDKVLPPPTPQFIEGEFGAQE